MVGVIGDPVAHSLSPLLHNTAFAELGLDWVSVGFRVAAGRAGEALAGAGALGLRGPVGDHAAQRSGRRAGRPPARRWPSGSGRSTAWSSGAEVGARVLGDNTDGAGLVAALRRGARFDPEGRRCLVVGAGGAARAAVAALAEAGAARWWWSTAPPARAASAAALAGAAGRAGAPGEAATCDLVVNATPVGMTGGPGPGTWPLDPALLRPGQTVVDLVYDPPRTPWLDAARDRGATAVNGLRHAGPPGRPPAGRPGPGSTRPSRPCGPPSTGRPGDPAASTATGLTRRAV